ncbi:MAG: hypothetical protein OIN89_10060 [Candidatus Methanoperedens sp.]|jgi:hypothetical protein|nr:hypothetical protein [Candidatus Methanoperedens sp.]PKL52984.1 MAG: hypothetical protein CVV36_09540 [Candidatus Methanoperedenaceae archaeon HGW-Methanoperedenaceae-1]
MNIVVTPLIYELYFCEKFHEDNLYPEPKHNLLDIVSKHLKPISYDRRAELEYKDQLTDDEKKDKDALEKKNMATIEKVYQRLRDDKEIQAHIHQIKAHPWVRVVES